MYADYMKLLYVAIASFINAIFEWKGCSHKALREQLVIAEALMKFSLSA